MSFLLTANRRAFGFLSFSLDFCKFYISTPLQHHTRNQECIYSSLLDKSSHRTHLNQIQTQLFIYGLHKNGFIITKFIRVSSNLKEIEYAHQLFDEFPQPHVFMWNAIIRGYYVCNMPDKVIDMYCRMNQGCAVPDAFTFPLVLKACGDILAGEIGRAVQAHIFRYGYENDLFLQNGLLSFYLKCGQSNHARVVFDRLNTKTVVSWTSVISGCCQNGQPIEALMIFRDMRESNVKPDWITLVSVMKAYSEVEDLEQGKSLHGLIIKVGLELELDLQISLTSLYAKCGQVITAKSLFDQLKVHDVILINAMISGYAKNGYADEALGIFQDMIFKKVQPDVATIKSCVLASAQLGSLEQAKWMDTYVSNSKFEGDKFVSAALVDMYTKCGSVELAYKVFIGTLDKDVVVWSAMIMGYGLHGYGREAIGLFNEMKNSGVHPNEVTFLGLLTACSHSGLVEKGWEFFHTMKNYGIEPRQHHYSVIVDLLGRAGFLDKAENFVKTMPFEPGVSIWGALLSACKKYRHVTLGEYAAEKLFSLDPLNTGHYVQLSNLYASVRRWDGVEKVRVLMQSRGLHKDSGYSMIEINGKLEVFRIGDKSHPRSEEIYVKLEWLEKRLLNSGFAHDTDSCLHDLDKEEKEMTLCNHSERLAIAYGLISTSSGTTLRIIKNLRACENCHLATKFISKFVNREIVVRDTNRFHHFKNGICSCGDYW